METSFVAIAYFKSRKFTDTFNADRFVKMLFCEFIRCKIKPFIEWSDLQNWHMYNNDSIYSYLCIK